jgi:cytochrome c-type protein NapB
VLAGSLLIASAVIAMAAITAARRKSVADGESARNAAYTAMPVTPREPIAAEADVFRTNPAQLAIDPTNTRRRGAHPRTLATYRSLRAYPGAPPRIPHGLTPVEALRGGCTTCHERGGYSHRFDAYVPLTPHPEMGMCLQCHVGDARLMAIPLPSLDPSARCRQCHSEGGMRWRDSATTWRSIPWPEIARVSKNTPPPIPHTLEMRGNCLACHSAPAGVEELRTAHPERASCRQCHLESTRNAAPFVREVSR